MKTYILLKKFFKEKIGYIILLSIVIILGIILESINPYLFGKIIDNISKNREKSFKLLGHTSIYSVHHYRKIGNKLMADETRAAREKMDMILLDIIEGWDDYEI